MKKVRDFLLFLVISNTFSLQHKAWFRPQYQEPPQISEELLSRSNALKLKRHEINAKIIENMMDLINMKFRTGKRNAEVFTQNTPDVDAQTINNIMKLISMKFRTGKRNIRDGDDNNPNLERDQNVMTLIGLRDDMEKRSFSSLRIRHDGWYLTFKIILQL